jgi:hypothetical protein
MDRDFIRVGRSQIEGVGVFARRRIPRGTRILEYAGDRVPMEDVQRIVDAGGPRVYSFALSEAIAIDGTRNGNDARFVNHSCAPNCEAYVFDERAYFYAMRDISRGEELTIDYRLGSADRAGRPSDESEYRCHCGAVSCRGTLLASLGDHA